MKVKSFLIVLSLLVLPFSALYANAGNIIYLNGIITSQDCSLVTTATGTSGSQSTGTVNWYNKSVECDGVTVATQSGYTTQYAGSFCSISLSNNTNYEMSGSQCNSAVISTREAEVLVYSNGNSVSSDCSIATTNTGTTGAPGMGNIYYYTKSFSCGGAAVATLSGYTSQYGGSDCNITLQNSTYRIEGSKCNSAKIYD